MSKTQGHLLNYVAVIAVMSACGPSGGGGGGGPSGPPAVPSGLTASATSSSSIHLIWSESSTDQTGFKLERSPNGSSFTQIATPSASATSYDDSGLSPSTTYYYRVCATNSDGDSSYSNTVQASTSASGGTVPTAPSNLVASATSSSAIHLTWSESSTNQAGFKLERSPNGSSFTQIATPSASATSYDDSGLSPSATYYYRIRATNSAGDSGYSSTAQATTQGAGACTAGATRCVAGNVGAMQTCNPSGTAWVQSNCTGWQACTYGTCRNECGLAADPAVATVCFSPNGDGVNPGLIMYWNGNNPMLLPGQNNYSIGGATKDGQQDDANVWQDNSLEWPYYWQFNGVTQQGMAYVEFTLWQFQRTPLTATISASARAASSLYNDYFTGAAWLNTNTITPGGRINVQQAPTTWTRVSLTCAPGSGTCDSRQFGYTYAAGINDMALSMTALGSYLAADDMQVNWVMLQVQ